MFSIFKKKRPPPMPLKEEVKAAVYEFKEEILDRLGQVRNGYTAAIKSGEYRFDKKKTHRLEGALNSVEAQMKNIETAFQKQTFGEMENGKPA